MATKFLVWAENASATSGGKLIGTEDLLTDEQRLNGFSIGQPASSQRVNSLLRSSSLVTAAFMQAFLPDSELDLTSSLHTTADSIYSQFANDITNVSCTEEALHITRRNGTLDSVSLSPILDTYTTYGATRDGNGNNIAATYATKLELSQAIEDAIGAVLNTEV